MSENQNFIYQDNTNYPNRVQVPAHCGFEPHYSHIETPINFYSQSNYNSAPQGYVQVEKIWTGNENSSKNNKPVSGEYWAVSNQRWATQQPIYQQAVPTPKRTQHRVLSEQNSFIPPDHQPVKFKRNSIPRQHAAVITHTNEYKEMIENRDPNYQALDRNWNASTRRVESETSIATNNLTNVLNADQGSENTDSQESAPEFTGKRATRSSHLRIFKRSTQQDTMERTNNTELMHHMKLKRNNVTQDSHGPSGDGGPIGDGEPPLKVQKISMQPKHIISWYLDHLIGENEEITEMSKSFTIPVNIFGSDDFYFMDSLTKTVSFPTPKFLQWMKASFPDINANAIDFYQKGGKRIIIPDPKRYWQDKQPHDIIKEVFYQFQEERILH